MKELDLQTLTNVTGGNHRVAMSRSRFGSVYGYGYGYGAGGDGSWLMAARMASDMREAARQRDQNQAMMMVAVLAASRGFA